MAGGLLVCLWLSAFAGTRTAGAASGQSIATLSDQRPAARAFVTPTQVPVATNMPPAEAGLNAPAASDAAAAPVHTASPTANVVARRKSRSSSPSPSASPADSPAAGSAGGDPASSSPAADDAASATPTPVPVATGTPSPAFVQKYEAAMVQFLQKNYPETKKLLDEADAIQPNQPNAINLRNQLFKQFYEAAYAAYQHADYAGAITQLDGADNAGSNSQNQSDAYNLRGLVLSKQHKYPEAENMFHKAVETDPGLWAAKFNYAEVPFNYKNFTVARTRFEALFSQTDPTKQPVEAELTQFKVFLTLLLEGKEDAARTFMQHFNFSGATPARYFCQAALNFYTGDVDKAQGWIDSARKEYPARKSSSFLEAFYRVGWLTDPNVPSAGAPSTALAAASPSPFPSAAPSAFQGAGSPAPTASPAVASSTPPVPAVASSSPAATASPRAAVTLPTTTPLVVAKASATPVVPAVAPSPTAPALVKATPAPAAAASSSPTATAMAKASVTPMANAAPSPTAPLLAKVPVTTPAASPSIAAAVVATPRPATSVPTVSVPDTTPAASPSIDEGSEPAARPASTGGDLLRAVIVGAVLLYFLYVVARVVLSAMKPKPKRSVAGGASSYPSRKAAKADQVESPR